MHFFLIKMIYSVALVIIIYLLSEQNLRPVIKVIVNDDLKFKTLTTYSFWEANKKNVRVEVPLKGVHTLSKENIKVRFEATTMEIKVTNLNGIYYIL